MIKLPGDKKQWIQPNNSDILGNIWASLNIDATEIQGKLRLGKRLILANNEDDSGLSSLFCPVAFKYHNGSVYTLGGGTSSNGKVFIGGSELQGTYTADSSSNAPTDIDSRYSDMENGVGKLFASGLTNIYECSSGGSWNATSRSVGGSGSPHLMTVYGTKLYATTLTSQILSADIAAGTLISAFASIGSAYTIQFTNSLSNCITFIRSSASRIWIGTVNTLGGKGYIYEWDGISTQATRAYRLESSGALSCVIKDDVPWVLDTNGNLLVWNGGNFQTVTGFNTRARKQLTNPISLTNNRFIHPNGMSVVDGKINTLINGKYNDNTGTQDETIASGIWEYDKDKGLIHKHSFGLSKSLDTITDYGQVRINQVGAISEIISPFSPSVSRNGKFLAGCTYFTDATTTKNGIFYDDINDTLQKAGSFTTPKLSATEISDEWQRIYLKYRKFLNTNDKIVLKYRIIEADPVEATITWTGTNTFTVPNSSVVVSNYWTSGTGGEVEVIQGLGSGKAAHITNAVLAAGTWTVTLDETFTSASSQTSKARFNSWIKLGSVTGQTTFFKAFPFPTISNSSWIQLKVWMLFTGKDELEEVQVISTSRQSSV